MTRSYYPVTAISIVTICFLAACTGFSAWRHSDVVHAPSKPSDVVLAADGKTVFVVESGRFQVTERRCNDGSIAQTYRCNAEPHAFALSPTGTDLYVSAGDDDGHLLIFDRNTGRLNGKHDTGHTPCAIECDSDGEVVYISNRFTSTVSVFDRVTNKVVENIPVLREPVDIALTPDNRFLLVANHLPSARQIPQYVTDGGYMDIKEYVHDTDYSVASVIMVIDTNTRRVVRMVHLPNGSTSVRGICVSPDGRYAYVSHILARYQLPTTQLVQGFMNTNAFSVIDLESFTYLDTVLLDSIDRGAANPWGIDCSPDGSHLYVTLAGIHVLSIIDRPALHRRLESIHPPTSGNVHQDSIGSAATDISFLRGIRSRVPLSGNGPRALAVYDSLVAVAEYFTGTLSLMTVSTEGTVLSQHQLSLGDLSAPEIFQGERLFNDASLCFQGWQSCASCHPDGRADALNWDLLNDGIGNPKNTKSLVYSHRTPPVMATGIRPDAETAVRAGLQHIQFNAYDEKNAVAIDAYLSALESVTSPHLSDPEIRRYARRGKRLFETTGCIDCHPAPLYTDLRSYNVGTGIGQERETAFDTPTLVELWRTAPYLYDGGAQAIDDIFRYYNRSDSHGNTSQLTESEHYELLCFLLTL